MNIIVLTAVKKNQLKITKLKTARKVFEASDNHLDIIEETELYSSTVDWMSSRGNQRGYSGTLWEQY